MLIKRKIHEYPVSVDRILVRIKIELEESKPNTASYTQSLFDFLDTIKQNPMILSTKEGFSSNIKINHNGERWIITAESEIQKDGSKQEASGK